MMRRDSQVQSPDESSRYAMDVCKVSDTSRVSISRTDHRPPERASEASERGGSLIILSPTSTFDVWPQTATRAQHHHTCGQAARKAHGIASPSASRTGSVPPPERASEASERGGSLIILSPTSTFDFWPQTATRAQHHHTCGQTAKRAHGIASPSASRTGSVPPGGPIP